MAVDVLSSAPKYRAHLRPVWDALPPELRGRWVELDRGAPQFRAEPVRAKRGDVALVAGYTDMRTARRAGYERIAYMEHGIGQTYGTTDAHLPGGNDRDPIGLFLSPNEHAASKDRDRYGRKARVEVIGAPRLDTLEIRQAENARPVVAVSFHWQRTLVPEMRSAFDHFAPSMLELSRRFDILGHAHPQASNVPLLWRRLGVRYTPDFGEVLRRADVYVCDNSSTLYEFAATGRPVVVLNAPEYRRDVEHGLRFWEAANVGVQVDEPWQLGDAISEALEDALERHQARDAALRVVYAHLGDGPAAPRAADALAEFAA